MVPNAAVVRLYHGVLAQTITDIIVFHYLQRYLTRIDRTRRRKMKTQIIDLAIQMRRIVQQRIPRDTTRIIFQIYLLLLPMLFPLVLYILQFDLRPFPFDSSDTTEGDRCE